MTAEKTVNYVTIDGLDLIHTYRGYNTDIEVYTYTTDNITYSLYRKPHETVWRCDWSKSYANQPIQLKADATDVDSMLKAFVAIIKSRSTESH